MTLLLPRNLLVNLCRSGDEITAEVFTTQEAAALAIGNSYLETIYAVECDNGRNFGFINLRGLWDDVQ